MGRRLVAAALPVAAVSFAWASLENEPDRLVFVAIVGSTLFAAVPSRLGSRVATAGVVLAGLALLLARSTSAALPGAADQALREISAVTPPFDASAHPELHLLVVLAAAALGLAIAVTAGSRPLAAAAVTAAGVAWPATTLPARNTVTIGALALLAALWPVALGAIRDRRGLVSGAAVLACIVVVATVGASVGVRPSTAALAWESWDLFDDSRAANTVALVWSSNYGGIDFPAKKTTVLRIAAPRRGLYWRATTLDGFSGDRWVEALRGTGLSSGGGTLPRDELLPAGSSSRRDWLEQKVEVRALIDDHVIAAGQPVEIAAGPSGRIRYLSGGVMRAPDGLRQMSRYTVWSYAPQPTPAILERSAPVYPQQLARYLDLGRTIAPPFGAPGRARKVTAIFADDLYQQLWPYQAVWRQARLLTAKARSPYQATIAIERWLRSDGGFTYDEHPPAPAGLPPLTDFATRTKRGYCQQFAGTMALMLRYLGIPARVAVGFTSGTWKNGVWTVTDHDAHAWVEAWFAGHGWLAFDPTPGRGTLSATYTNASDSADAIRALGAGRYLDLRTWDYTARARGVSLEEETSGTSARWSLSAPAAALVAALLALATAKSINRRRGFASGDPRGRASAARAELAAFIRDQGSAVAGTASVAELVVELRRLGVGGNAFAEAFSRARYGPPDGAAGAADDARRELRRVRSILRARLGPGKRVRGFLTVRSLRSG